MLARGVRTSLGNMAANIKHLRDAKGVDKIKVLKNQILTDTYKEIENADIITKNGVKHVKSWVPFLPDRPVMAETGRGSYIIKKRMPYLTGITVGGTGATAALTDYGLSATAMPKGKTTGAHARDAGITTALGTVWYPAGLTYTTLKTL